MSMAHRSVLNSSSKIGVTRRKFICTLGTFSCALPHMVFASPRAPDETDPILAGRPLVRYPEKTDLILLTSRPPQLETPKLFRSRDNAQRGILRPLSHFSNSDRR